MNNNQEEYIPHLINKQEECLKKEVYLVESILNSFGEDRLFHEIESYIQGMNEYAEASCLRNPPEIGDCLFLGMENSLIRIEVPFTIEYSIDDEESHNSERFTGALTLKINDEGFIEFYDFKY
jgi:hypothetical protein